MMVMAQLTCEHRSVSYAQLAEGVEQTKAPRIEIISAHILIEMIDSVAGLSDVGSSNLVARITCFLE